MTLIERLVGRMVPYALFIIVAFLLLGAVALFNAVCLHAWLFGLYGSGGSINEMIPALGLDVIIILSGIPIWCDYRYGPDWRDRCRKHHEVRGSP
jgi:hypothetical protein